MSDDSEIEGRRRKNMSSKRSKGKGKRSLSTANDKGAKRRRLESVGRKETSKTRGKPYDCQLCETAFNNVSSRNGHYSGKHKVHDEKLLFFPNGTGLVESSLEHQISLKPDWFKAAVRSKRRTTVCKLCEVDLDTEDHLNLHYKDIHKVTRMSVLSELIRLKNTDIKKVAVTHKCSSCTASFDEAQELELHMKSAHDADYKRCDYCNIRVQIDVYNAHIQKKHADMIEKRVEPRRSVVEVPEPKIKQAKREKKVKAVKKLETPKREVNKDKVRKTKDQKVADWCSKLVPAAKKTALTLYLCKACKLATASYDNAVSHAQDHILNLPTATNHCKICNLNFAADFGIHKKMHVTNEDLDADSFRLFPYDYRLLMSHKWFDMFVNSSKTMANKVRSASIYFPSRCIRLKIEKESKDPSERFTLFMCVTCNKYVDPPSIELHVEQQGDCSNQLSCYLCYQCQRQFFSQKARDQHSSTHEIPDASKRYRTVLFNDRSDLICNRKLLQAGMNIVVTNNERMHKNATENSESIVETDIITVVNEALYQADTVHKIENDVLNELFPTVTDNDVVADIYECKCGLSFDRLEFLCKHWKICSPALKLVTKTCKCGLIFDKQNYDYHCTVHSKGATQFTVNEVSIRVKNSIDVRHIKDEFINATELNISEIVYNGMEEDNVREENMNKDTQGRILQNLQVVNIANVKEVATNNLLNERKTLSNHVHHPVNIENYQQSSNDYDSAEFIFKTEDDSKTVYEQFETYKLLISNDISNNVSQSELQNHVAMDVKDASISVQNYDVPDNTNVCSSNADENQCMVDTTMEIDLRQGTYQDKNLLISNTKEQDCVKNSNPDKDPLIRSLEENKLGGSTLSHDNVRNANSVNRRVGVVEDVLDDAKIKEMNTYDEAMINTEGDKADVQFVDNKIKNTEICQQTSNEQNNTEFLGKTQTNIQTVDKKLEADKILISNDISNTLSQTDLENRVVMDVRGASISIQNDDVPDNKNVCSNNVGENQSMVDTSMEIDLYQGICQDINLLICNTKEQAKVEISEPEKVPVSPSLQENKARDSVLKEIPGENVIHNTSSVNEDRDVDDDNPFKTESGEESNTRVHDEAANNTQGAKADIEFVDNQNKSTENFQKTGNDNDSVEYIGKTQANSQTVDKEFEVHKVLISNDIGTNLSQTELDHQVALGVTDASISIQNDGVPDDGNVCYNNADEKQCMVDTLIKFDLRQGICQDKNLLIGNTKEQAWEGSHNIIKEIPQENVIHNANSVNEDSDVVEDKHFKTEIREKSGTHDEAANNTQGAKADIEFVDNQNKNAENDQQNSNEQESTKKICNTIAGSQSIDKEYEANKVFISNDIGNNVSQTELEHQVAMEVTDASISIQKDGVPDNGNVCNNNRDEKQSMVDTSMEIDLQQETYQNNVLISNIKEQDSIENTKPEKYHVRPLPSDSELKEISHENVLRNVNSVNEVSSVIEDILDNTEIRKEVNTYDEARTHTQGDKADVQFLDSQNNTGNYEQSRNEHDNTKLIGKTQVDSQTVDEDFEGEKVLISNDTGNIVSQTELKNPVAMDITDASVSVQNYDVADNTNVCSSNADENQCMVDTTMEIDLQQGTYQDNNLLISNTKEQNSVENSNPEKDLVSQSLEENKLSGSTLSHESVLQSFNELIGMVKDILDNSGITKDIKTHGEAMATTQGDKADVQIVDNQNNITGNDQQTSNEYDKQVNSQTVDNEFVADKVLISNDISNNVSQTELENRVAMDVTDASISVQNDVVPDNTNVCSNNAGENLFMVDTSMEIDLQQGKYEDMNLLISNTKEHGSVDNSEPEKDPVSPPLEENKLSDSVMKEIPHVNSVNEVSDVVETLEESKTHNEAVINTQELWAKEADVEFVDRENKHTERNYIKSSHPKDKENERENIGTETQYAYNNQATEMVYSEEELLDGPEDADVEDSLLTDDEDL